MIQLWNKIKIGVITAVIVFVVTMLITWIVNYGKSKLQAQTYEKYTDSIKTIQRKLNDSVTLMVTERIVYHQTLSEAKKSNSILRSIINSDILKRNIQSTMSVMASVNNTRTMQMVKMDDSTEIYKSAYHDVYNTLEMIMNDSTKEITLAQKIKVPINQVVYLKKTDYLQYKGIKRIWKRIWEKPKLTQRIYSDNPDVILDYQELIQIQK